MLPVGMRNASTRKVRMSRNRPRAMRMDLSHSHAQRPVDIVARGSGLTCSCVSDSRSAADRWT